MRNFGFKSLGVLAGLCSMSAPAFAGHWELHYECTGSDTHNGDDNGGEQTSPRAWPSRSTSVISQGWNWDEQTDRWTHNATEAVSDGQVKAIFTWVPRAGQNLTTDPPPSSLGVIERSFVSAYDWEGKQGFRNPRLNSVTEFNHLEPSEESTIGDGKGYLSRNLKTFDVSNGVVELEERSLKASCKAPDPDNDVIKPSVRVQYSVEEDTRSVKLSRGGRHERSVLEDGEWHTYGDSIYSAKGRPDSNADKRVPLSIQASYGGNWGTKTTSWTAEGFAPAEGAIRYEEDENDVRGITVFGTPEVAVQPVSPTFSYHTYYPSEPTGAQDYDTTLTVTDTDDADATAHYHLTLHDPVELLDEGEGISTYSLRSPMRLNGQIMAWLGERTANTAETPVKIVTSTETGVGFTATASIDALKSLLGFSAEASATSTLSVSVSTETEVPAIDRDKMVYLIAIHNFQRKHVRFMQFDEAGRVPRMVTRNSSGTVFNPPVEMYHEAFQDTAFMPNYEWSDQLSGTTDLESLPHDTVPPLEYDFSGGAA